ncbi:eukaryotic translation initiation factor 3 subunit A-like [Euwallacea similis]|uniref:eukaryotic translation initiation factor 3 subunit A-like n=1 Tax=Euwallacea similis TaxID=1736056 RepID=UPI00344DA34F
MSGIQKRVPQAGKNPATGSDRVKAPVTSAGPKDSGGGQNRSGVEGAAEEEEMRGMESPFARSERMQRSPPTRRETAPGEIWRSLAASEALPIRRASEGTVSALGGEEFFSAFSLEMPPSTSTPSHRGKRRREAEESLSQSTGEMGTALEEAVTRAEDLERLLKRSYRPSQELVNAVSGLRSVLRRAAREDRTGEELERLREENGYLRRRIKATERDGATAREMVDGATQTESAEERRVREQRERIHRLVAFGELRAAIRERWEEGLFSNTEQVSGDPYGEGYGSDLGVIVGGKTSAARGGVLRVLPELEELGEDQEGRVPFLVQSCRLRKGGRTEEKTRYVFYRRLSGEVSPKGVYGALSDLVETAREEGRTRVVVGGAGGGGGRSYAPLLSGRGWEERDGEGQLKRGGGHLRHQGGGDDLPGCPQKGTPGGRDRGGRGEGGHGQGNQEGRGPSDRAQGGEGREAQGASRQGAWMGACTPKTRQRPVAASTPRTEQDGEDSPSTSFLRSLVADGDGGAVEGTGKN